MEDSPVVREFLIHIFSSDPGITVIATAYDGEEALELVRRQRPDVITMDIHMPKLNGLEATRSSWKPNLLPLSSSAAAKDPFEVATTFNAMDAGALAVLRRPAGIGHADHQAMAQDMVQTIKLMSEVKVVRRWPRMRPATPASRPETPHLEIPYPNPPPKLPPTKT